MTPISSKLSMLSQLRQFRKSNSELTKNEPGEDAESDVAETVKDAVVRLMLRLCLHDVDGLNRNVVLVFGHDWSLLVVFEFDLRINEVKALSPPPRFGFVGSCSK